MVLNLAVQRIGQFGKYGIGVSGSDFVLRGLPTGEYRLILSADGIGKGLHFERRLAMPVAGEYRVDFDLPDSRVAGKVTARDGRPIEDAHLLFVPLDLARASERGTVYGALALLTDADGSFDIWSVTPGDYALVARRDGFARVGVKVHVSGAPGEVIEKTLVLPLEAPLFVKAVDRSGEHVPLSAVEARPLPDPGDFVKWYGEILDPGEGTWRVRGLPAGEVEVRSEAPGFFPDRRTVRVVESKETWIAVPMRRLGSLRVRVKGADGSVRAGWPVELIDEETGESVADWIPGRGVRTSTGGLFTDPDGRLLVEHLPEGRYTLSSAGAARHVEVIPGEETETSLTVLE